MMSAMFTLMMTMDVKKSYATMKTSLNVSYEELRWKFLTSLCSRLSVLLGQNE